jgi:hypothetical protein
MLLELQWLYPAQQCGVVANATIGYPNASPLLQNTPRNSAQTHSDTPTTVPKGARKSAHTRPQRYPDTPATALAHACNNASTTIPATTMPAHARNSARTRPQQRPGSAKRLVTTDQRGWRGVASDEEVLEQMLLLTRSYRSGAPGVSQRLHWTGLGSGTRIQLQSNPTRSLDWWL